MGKSYWVVTDEDTGEQLKSIDRDVAEVFYKNRVARNHETKVEYQSDEGTVSLVKIYWKDLHNIEHIKT